MSRGGHNPFGGGNRIIQMPARPVVIANVNDAEREWEKKQAMRGFESGIGGEAFEPAADPILLTDLVAGWALTDGPEQTLSSAGVVASGDYDLTERGGSPSYDDDGAHLSGSSHWLDVTSAGLLVGNNDFFIMAEVKYDDFDPIPALVVISTPEFAFEVALATYSNPPNYKIQGYTNNDPFVSADDTANLSAGTRYILFLWRSGATLSVAVNNATAATATLEGTNPSSPSAGFYIGSFAGVQDYLDGYIRRVRLWRGDVSVVSQAANRTWLYNSGSGRTDAEVAAYTG